MPPPPELVTWWLSVRSRAHSPVLIIVCLNDPAVDFQFFRDDLPANMKESLFVANGADGHFKTPIPGANCVWFASFTKDVNTSLAAAFALWSFVSSSMRVVFVPAVSADGVNQLEVAQAFASQQNKRPSGTKVTVTQGWPAGGIETLNTAINDYALEAQLPLVIRGVNSLRPCDRYRCVVLAGLATHALWNRVFGAHTGRVEHLTMRNLPAQIARWEFFTRDLSLLIIDSSVSESIDTRLYSTGYQGVLRAIVDDPKRLFNVVVLVGDGDVAHFRKLGDTVGRSNGWYCFVVPEDVMPTTVAASAGRAAQQMHNPNRIEAPKGALAVLNSIRPLNEQQRAEQSEYEAMLHMRFALGKC